MIEKLSHIDDLIQVDIEGIFYYALPDSLKLLNIQPVVAFVVNVFQDLSVISISETITSI